MDTLTSGTTIYFRGTVTYEGRAIGNLPLGNYLLLIKNDRSVSIHGGTKISPRNYLGTNCEFSGETQDGYDLILSKKNETITIHFEHIHYQRILNDWSTEEVTITNTEAHLVQKLISEIDLHIPNVKEIRREVQSGAGPIDIWAITDDEVIHVIEVKRRKASIADCSQLDRYVRQFRVAEAKGYLASPSIGKKALAYLESSGYSWIEVSFQELNSVT